MEHSAAAERDQLNDQLTTKNHKLNKKIDKYKTELDEARQDIAAVKSQLEQTRQDKVNLLSMLIAKMHFTGWF